MITRTLAVLFVATVALAAQSQPPAPTTTPDTQNQQSQGEREASPPADVNQSPRSGTSTVNQPPTNGNAAERREQGNKAEDQTPTQWWTLTPAVISAISAGVSAIFAVLIWMVYKGQWRTMAEQAQYMRDGLAETRKAADAATKGAEVAEKSVALAEREFVISHPPRLVVRNISIPQIGPIVQGRETRMKDLTDAVTGRFWISNIGRTEARIWAVHSQWVVGPLPMTNPAQEAAGETMNVPIAAGHSLNVSARPGALPVTEDFDDPNDLHGIINRKTALYIVGFVSYYDRINTIRRTLFCRIFDYESGRFKPVNDADYNYED